MCQLSGFVEVQLPNRSGVIDKPWIVVVHPVNIDVYKRQDQYSVTTVSGSKNFLDEFLESQLGEVKLSIIKNVLGNEFEYFKTLNNIKTNCGIQARMPYDMKPL